MTYQFSETEQEHAKRLGGHFHQCRQHRRAILYILTDYQYSELPHYLVELGLNELTRRVAVRLQGKLLVPHGRPSLDLLADGVANAMHSTADPNAPQLVRMNALKAGGYHGAAPYPYVNIKGHISISPGLEKLVSLAIATAPEGYSTVAGVLNDAGFKTSTKRKWNKDTARTFLQNPIHAGFAITYAEKLKSGGANKRGDLVLYRLFAAMPNPPIDYLTWLSLNPAMKKRSIVLVNAS